MEPTRVSLIVIFTLFGVLFQFLPFILKLTKYGHPSNSDKEINKKSLTRKYPPYGDQTKEKEEIKELYRDALSIVVGIHFQFLALLISLF